MHISQYPRLHFAHLPTPLEPLKSLSEYLGGPNIWIKRDDCTGLAGGGNKTRKLEFLMADAQLKKANVIITQGATQSNHARQTAAISAKMGLECHLIFEDRTGYTDPAYKFNGNVLMDQLFGAHLSSVASGTDMNAEMEALADKLRSDGKTPYIIPGGGSNEIGALGYVNCAFELLYQASVTGMQIDHVVHGTGSAGTQAGLVTGFEMSNSHVPVLGIGVRAAQELQETNVYNLAVKTAEYLNIPGCVQREDVKANCDYVGEGYGFPAESTIDAINLFASTESILLDPVYSGKGGAGLIDLIKKGYFKKGENVIFLHTGGAQALYGYRSAFGFTDYSV